MATQAAPPEQRPDTTLPGHPRIGVDPAVCFGKPRVAGTRMGVEWILRALAAGDTADEIVADFPYVSHDDIVACLAFGAELASRPIAPPAG